MHVNASTTPTSNPVISKIIQHQPAVLDFVAAAAILGFSPESAYAQRARGTFPVRVRQHGKRLVVFTSDLVAYLETGENQAEQSAALIRKTYKVRTGRPTKREALEASRRGLTVKELRAQAALKIDCGRLNYAVRVARHEAAHVLVCFLHGGDAGGAIARVGGLWRGGCNVLSMPGGDRARREIGIAGEVAEAMIDCGDDDDAIIGQVFDALDDWASKTDRDLASGCTAADVLSVLRTLRRESFALEVARARIMREGGAK